MPDPDELSRGELIALVREQALQLEQVRAENVELRARLNWLERLLSRNSENPSMPPSTDDLPGRRPPAGKPAADDGAVKRKRGKQPGAPGSHLAWRDVSTFALFVILGG